MSHEVNVLRLFEIDWITKKSAGEVSIEALENIDNSFDNHDPLPSSHKLYTCSKYFPLFGLKTICNRKWGHHVTRGQWHHAWSPDNFPEPKHLGWENILTESQASSDSYFAFISQTDTSLSTSFITHSQTWTSNRERLWKHENSTSTKLIELFKTWSLTRIFYFSCHPRLKLSSCWVRSVSELNIFCVSSISSAELFSHCFV